MPNPYAPRTQRASAPSFPEGRFRRIGMTDDEVTDARARWDALTADEATAAAESIAALTDDELLADLEDQREAAVLEGLNAWAHEQVADGAFINTDVALDVLEALAFLPDDERAALLEAANSPAPCLLCAELAPETVALLPEHDRLAHVGSSVLDRPVEGRIEGNPFPDLEPFTVEWWTAAGYTVLAQHDDDGQVARFDPPADGAEVAPGGPGEAGEVSPNGSPEGGTDPTPGAELVADARARIADGTPPSKLLRWMGTDKGRAAALLVAERERPEPRVAVTSGATAVLETT